jgi:hypothetical protein
MMAGRREDRDPPVPASRRQPQPRHEPADVLEADLAPVQAAAVQEGEVVLQIMGISPDRVRRPLNVSQVSQVALDRGNGEIVVPQNRPRLKRRDG